MIYDVIGTLETQANDGSVGLNAKITAVNADKSESLPQLATIQGWGPTDGRLAELPVELAKPALVFAWDDSSGVRLISQGKRRPTHRIRAYYYDEEPDQVRARKNATLMQTAMMRWLDGLPEQGTIAEVGEARFRPINWKTAGRELTGWEAEFEIQEIDEAP